MTQVRRLTALLLALLFALSVLPAAADDLEDEGTLDDFSEFDGIQYAVSRGWSVDFAAMMEVTPTDDNEDPFADLTGVWFISGFIMEFENDGNAEDAFDILKNISDEELTVDMDENAELTRDDVDDLGDQAHAFTIVSEDEENGGYYRYTFAQQDNYLFMGIALSTDDAAAAAADELVAAMADVDDDHSGLGEFNADGTSTDGLWEFFPDDDEEFLSDLIVSGDEVLYPEQDEDEEA